MFKLIYNGENEKLVHKNVFSETLAELAKEDKNLIYLDADLTNSAGTYKFWQENPNQAFNCGIAEANMMGVAAGLALMGKKPYVHTFGPFASRRCFDQIFISQGYARNTVRIFGSDPGIQAAFNGATHMPFEDMALLRSIPNSLVFDLADAVQLKWLLRAIKDIEERVIYFRSTRKSYRAIYSEDSEFKIGKANLLRDGKDLTIIACGMMVGEALEAAEILAEEGISAEVIDCFTVKPIDKDMLRASAIKTGCFVVSENHNVMGGLNDAVSEALRQIQGDILSETKINIVHVQHGVEEQFGEVGPVDYLKTRYKLNAEEIVKKAKEALTRKFLLNN